MKKYLATAVVLGFAGIVAAQNGNAPEPVAVDQEPMHRVVLRNDSVIVMHVVIPAGERSLFHIHSHDRVALYLNNSLTTQQNLNEPESAATPSEPGGFSNRTQTAAPLIHRVHNTGTTPFEVLDVELLQRPQKPSEAVAGPVAAENPSARIYKWILAPGASSAMHTHERPYLIVSVTPMQLKMTGPDGKSMVHEVKAGDFHWVDAKVTHSLSNEGSTTGQIIEVELK
jgi:quercetin dioxygenase-like cupin family protein